MMSPNPNDPELRPITRAEYEHQGMMARLLIAFFNAHGLRFNRTTTGDWTRHEALLDDHGHLLDAQRQTLEVALRDNAGLATMSDFESVALHYADRNAHLGTVEVTLKPLFVAFVLNYDDETWHLDANLLAGASPPLPLVAELGLDKLAIGSIGQEQMLSFLINFIEHFGPKSD